MKIRRVGAYGLAAVLHTSALAFAVLKYCGVAYLLYMAWQALRERGALAVDARGDARPDARLGGRSSRRVIVTGILINILNPKLSIFFLAFLPQFVDADAGHVGAAARPQVGDHRQRLERRLGEAALDRALEQA